MFFVIQLKLLCIFLFGGRISDPPKQFFFLFIKLIFICSPAITVARLSVVLCIWLGLFSGLANDVDGWLIILKKTTNATNRYLIGQPPGHRHPHPRK